MESEEISENEPTPKGRSKSHSIDLRHHFCRSLSCQNERKGSVTRKIFQNLPNTQSIKRRIRFKSGNNSFDDAQFSTPPSSPVSGDKTFFKSTIKQLQKTQESLRRKSEDVVRLQALRNSSRRLSAIILETMSARGQQQPDRRNCSVVNINVSGMRFTAYKSTLRRYPTTLLGNQERLNEYFIAEKNVYFFDRPRSPFTAILSYYQTGVIRRPASVTLKLMLRELEFFEIPQDAIRNLLKLEKVYDLLKPSQPPRNIKIVLHEWFCQPNASKLSMAIFVLRLLFTTTLVILVILSLTEQVLSVRAFWISSCVLNCILYVDLVIRVIIATDLKTFLQSFHNWVDFLAGMAVAISAIMFATGNVDKEVTNLVPVPFRILQLCRIVEGVNLAGAHFGIPLFRAIRSSTIEILSIFAVIGILSVFFGVFMFFAELTAPKNTTNIDSIGSGIWFAIVTMTTVGYGDLWPVSYLGRIFAAICGLIGSVVIAMIVPVVSNLYQEYYDAQKAARTLKDISTKLQFK